MFGIIHIAEDIFSSMVAKNSVRDGVDDHAQLVGIDRKTMTMGKEDKRRGEGSGRR